MDQLLAMRVYRTLAETRSFSIAGDRLDMTHSTVSRQLRQLEAVLGVQLVQRSTRHFSLTDDGERYYASCVDILDRVDAAADALSTERAEPSGLLRVSIPMAIGTFEMGAWLPAFRACYPKVQLDISCSDRFVNLVADGFDVALRITGALSDSELVARTLTRSDEILVAAPAYVARRGLPRSPVDLAGHDLLMHRKPQGDGDWTLTADNGDTTGIAGQAALRIDAITAVHAAAVAGLGIAAFTHLTVARDIAEGRLVRILPGYRLGQLSYYAVYPRHRHTPARVRVFVEHMKSYYASWAKGSGAA
ncbi:TPA: LysR family transcriptional regulator [Burkholderia cenocepacia]|uniref:LysR family transcriptional regulator n=1 Tax=unclassified Burkholderia TaxID=2613784 RepID=UPI00158ED2C2|nr:MULTISPECIES: LysR family transcriptional regulator [unclassified Burkholderia]HEF5874864.1 LysR family transcriptional regulator [Burkholderia cenocepacia]